GDKECLEIRNSALASNSPVYLVRPGDQPSVEQGKIAGLDESCRDPNAESPELQPYEIRLEQKSAQALTPAIAIAGAGVHFEKRDGLLVADLDGDGKPEYFRSCTSAEGFHFTVWTGPPLTGKLRWRQYYYLGYDVQPDCTTQEATPGASR